MQINRSSVRYASATLSDGTKVQIESPMTGAAKLSMVKGSNYIFMTPEASKDLFDFLKGELG